MAADLLQNAESIATHALPDFVSITYGAGGSTSRLTYLYTQILRERFGWVVMPHLTCVGHTRDELLAIAESYHRIGVRSIMALRGDMPKQPHTETDAASTSGAREARTSDFCEHASDLVRLLKSELPEICLGVAGYPEKHPQAPDIETDIAYLKEKMDAGGNFVTTQLFYDTSVYAQFVEKCRAAGIRAPILPGLMPVLGLEQAKKFCSFCGATLPEELVRRLNAVSTDDQWKVGVDWTLEQAEELIQADAPGIHLYILNRDKSALSLIRKLRERHILKQS